MKALIVDDEVRVRKAVRLLVDWDKHGIHKVLEASGGDAAAAMIQEEQPALVIMDMMMGAGHGLDLMAWVSEHTEHVKFIVVSGHNDFDYVRNTVRHGGIDYILKPIDPEAINLAVTKAMSEWQQEEEDKRAQQQQSIQLNEFKPVYGEKLLSSLIDDPLAANAALKKLHSESVIPVNISTAQLLLLKTDCSDDMLLKRFGNNMELLHFAIINIANECLQGKGTAFRYWGSPHQIVLLIWEEAPAGKITDEINEALELTMQRKMHFGAAIKGPLISLGDQFKQAGISLLRRNLLQTNQHLHMYNPATVPPAFTFADAQDHWKIAVMSGQKTNIEAAAKEWVDKLLHGGIITTEWLNGWTTDMHAFRANLLREVLPGDAEQVLIQLESEDDTQPRPNAEAYTFSLYAWRDWSSAFMHRLAEALSKRHAPENGTIKEIVKYVEQHYADELSLQEIASRYHISREYVSRKFKQEYGINFSDFITEYRIERARMLMQNPHLKLVQIAQMVGFQDVKYFSKVFKKLTGISPKEYRDRSKCDVLP
ncbi:helix-turn-helix domain-containing protein [Neobacillus mesonae]|nr:helix-turn-helix domain-containing protein [Neobacillus mesonae]